MAYLRWKDKTLLEGNEEPLSRLSSLLQFCVKWFAVTSLVLVGVLIIAGHVFFNRYGHADDAINWQMPWV
ncbi:hypothetical protein, partial [Staphylococcus aureus]|uniref:hypothetical protein n=1 Tax=Staphylococcus aureus TaxID=1280 RepID=UPI001EE397D1